MGPRQSLKSFTTDRFGNTVDEETRAALAMLDDERALGPMFEVVLSGDESGAQRAAELVDEVRDELNPPLEALLNGRFDRQPGAEFAEGPPVPRARNHEFVCSGCFLICHRAQLANGEQNLCRDCADMPAGARAA